MATTTKATTPKRTTKATKAASSTAELDALKSQVAQLSAQVENLTAALEGKDIDGDGVADVAGLRLRVDNIVKFMKRMWGEGPMEQNGVD